MYHRRACYYGCGYDRIHKELSGELSREDRRKRVAKLFNVDEEDLEVTLRRVVSVTCLSEYFQFAYSKDILDAKSAELNALKTDVIRYESWRKSSKKIPFKDLVAAIDFVLTNLK